MCFLPSYEVTQEQFTTPPFTLPKVVTPGTPILVKSSTAKEFYIQGKPSSPLPNDNLFAVVGLSDHEEVVVHGPIETDSKVSGPFSHPRATVFRDYIHVAHSKRKAAKLRLPSSVWKKVNHKHNRQKRIDRERMWYHLKQVNGFINDDCWQQPLYSKVVSKFASPRTLPNGRSYYHSGLDLRAPTGTAIRAPSSAKVVLAEKMVLPGNVIVLDHGGGLYSRYMHLSRFKAKVGQEVKPEQVIGLAGATGRVEGPHLHWEVVWKGNRASPRQFLEIWEQICDQG